MRIARCGDPGGHNCLTVRCIAIIGAGQAGGRAAEALRAAQFAGPITLIGGERHLPYERPQLSKSMLVDGAAPKFIRSSEQWAEIEVDLQVGANAVACDPERRVVALQDGREFHFDKILMATGTRPRRLPALEAGPVPVAYLRDIGNSISLRDGWPQERAFFLLVAA